MNLKSEHTPNSKSFMEEVAFCIIAWSNTYQTTLQPLFILQKKALRIITFPSCNEHSSPLFKDININVVKLSDIIGFQLAVLMYKFHNNLLPSVFDPYFNSFRMLHIHNTRISSKMTCYSNSQSKLWNFQHLRVLKCGMI